MGRRACAVREEDAEPHWQRTEAEATVVRAAVCSDTAGAGRRRARTSWVTTAASVSSRAFPSPRDDTDDGAMRTKQRVGRLRSRDPRVGM